MATPQARPEANWLAEAEATDLRRIVDALYRVHGFLSAITDLDTLLNTIIEESKLVAQADASSLMLYEESTHDLFFHVAIGEHGNQQALKSAIRLKLGEGIAGAAAETRQVICVDDAQKDERFFRRADTTSKFETRTVLAVPLLDRDRLIGVLEVLNKTDGTPFTQVDIAIMEMFGSLVATAIANARLIEENLQTERLAAIGQAMAGLSHYAKNVIAGLSGSIEMASEGLQNEDLSLVTRTWPILRRSSTRLADFVEDMLAFSRPRKPMYESCNLAKLIKEAEETFWALLARRQISVTIDTSEAHAPVHAAK